jgi:hypothetical protein
MLTSVQFLKIFARVLIACVVAATPQLFTHPDGADDGDVRAIRRPIAITLTRALRLTEGMMLTRDGARLDITGRPNHLPSSTSAAGIGISPPVLNGALISQTASVSSFSSRTSAPLRGPPDTI